MASRNPIKKDHETADELPNPAVVMPAHNEGASVGRVIQEIQRYCDFPIYVVDDSSSDNTVEVANAAGALVLPLANQLGAWGATQAGIRFAQKRRHSAVITVDADGQHDPKYLQNLLEPLLTGNADVCIGAWPDRGSKLRHVAWTLLQRVSGMEIEDLTSGFRAYNNSAMQQLSGWRGTFLDYQDVGVLSLLLSNGARIVDIRTPMRQRQCGHSRIFKSWLVVASYMCHSLLLGLTKRPIKRYQPRHYPRLKVTS